MKKTKVEVVAEPATSEGVMTGVRVTRSSDRIKGKKAKGAVPDHVRRGTLSPQQKGKLRAAFRRAMSEK